MVVSLLLKVRVSLRKPLSEDGILGPGGDDRPGGASGPQRQPPRAIARR